MIYLYGLIEAPAPVVAQAIAGLPGLQASPQVAAFEPYTLVFSDQDDADILPKRRLMLTHTRVLEHMLPHGPVLPARFGMVADDVWQTEALMTQNQAGIEQAFAQIRGAVELSIRIHFPRQVALEATLAANPNLASRRDRLAAQGTSAHFDLANFGEVLADLLDRRRAAAQSTLLAALKPLVKSYVLQTPDSDAVVLRAAVLIAAADQLAFEDVLQTTAATLTFAPGAEPMIQIIGPAPAYNFVRLNLSQNAAETAA